MNRHVRATVVHERQALRPDDEPCCACLRTVARHGAGGGTCHCCQAYACGRCLQKRADSDVCTRCTPCAPELQSTGDRYEEVPFCAFRDLCQCCSHPIGHGNNRWCFRCHRWFCPGCLGAILQTKPAQYLCVECVRQQKDDDDEERPATPLSLPTPQLPMPDLADIDVSVQNIVYTTDVGTRLKLPHVARALQYMGAEFNLRRFAAVILRFVDRHAGGQAIAGVRGQAGADQPTTLSYGRARVAVLLSSAGKIVCTGSKHAAQARIVVYRVANALRQIGYDDAHITSLNVQNWVGRVHLPAQINQGELARVLSEYCSYDPELFPGVVMRKRELFGPIAILIFRSGKMVITGAKSLSDARSALTQALPMIWPFAMRAEAGAIGGAVGAVGADIVSKPRSYMRDPFVRPVAELNCEVEEFVRGMLHEMGADREPKREPKRKREPTTELRTKRRRRRTAPPPSSPPPLEGKCLVAVPSNEDGALHRCLRETLFALRLKHSHAEMRDRAYTLLAPDFFRALTRALIPGQRCSVESFRGTFNAQWSAFEDRQEGQMALRLMLHTIHDEVLDALLGRMLVR